MTGIGVLWVPNHNVRPKRQQDMDEIDMGKGIEGEVGDGEKRQNDDNGDQQQLLLAQGGGGLLVHYSAHG
jgi:hypothetical protein